MKFSLSLFTSLCVTLNVGASTLVALQNQEVAAPVNEEMGSLFQFPSAVNTITPSKYFIIKDVASEIDKETGLKTDVRTFEVRPIDGARSESVTFVLAGGKNVSLKFTPAKDADKFYDVHFEGAKKKSKSFLAEPMSMMKSMILDENGGFSREITERKINTELKNYEFTLTRIYSASDFVGYVFNLKNTGKEKEKINLSKFAFGYPNQAVIAHVNNEELVSCPFFGSNNDCITKLHVVVRGNKNQPLFIVSSSQTPPFVKTNSESLGASK